jgi:hypothetical protein
LEDEEMRSWIRPGVLMLGLVAGVSLAGAQESATTDQTVGVAGSSSSATDNDTTSSATDNDTTGSLGTVGIGDHEILPLSDEQRGWIFMGVINIPDVPDAPITAQEAVNDLPPSVDLQELPPIVTRRIPLVGAYKFVKLDDRILLVDPADRAVVAQIPRYKLIN